MVCLYLSYLNDDIPLSKNQIVPVATKKLIFANRLLNNADGLRHIALTLYDSVKVVMGKSKKTFVYWCIYLIISNL